MQAATAVRPANSGSEIFFWEGMKTWSHLVLPVEVVGLDAQELGAGSVKVVW